MRIISVRGNSDSDLNKDKIKGKERKRKRPITVKEKGIKTRKEERKESERNR